LFLVDLKMSVKEIKDEMEKGNVLFGIRQALKGKKKKVFVVKDVREETLGMLKVKKIEPAFLKLKDDVVKELGLDFNCEVFSIK